MKHNVTIKYNDNAHLILSNIEKRKKRRRRKDLFHILFPILIIMVFVVAWNMNRTQAHLVSKPSKEVLLINIAEPIKEVVKKPLNEFSINEKAFTFIIGFEGYHDKPYWDYKQWSCWYGLACSKYTTNITRVKSKAFVIDRIERIRTKWELKEYSEEMQIWLTSFIYNIWSPPIWYKWYIKNGYINALKNTMRKYSYAWWIYLRGLNKRRNAEVNLF